MRKITKRPVTLFSDFSIKQKSKRERERVSEEKEVRKRERGKER
jgi:hypothetical protein